MSPYSLSFPGLGLDFVLNPVAFTVFGWSIRWYGVIIAVGFLAGMLYCMGRVKTFGVYGDRFMDVILGAVLLGIVGARLYYVAFRWEDYRENPITIFFTWWGGIAIYGGLIGAVVAILIMTKLRKVKLLPAMDLAVGGLILAQAVGRWGNFINIEAFGSNTTAPWGMTGPAVAQYLRDNRQALTAIGVTVDPSLPVHPTFFYESIWCLIGFALIFWYTKRRRFDGELTLVYFLWYGLGRAVVEGFRTDSLLFGTVRVSQLVAVLCVIASAIALIAIRSKIRRESDPDFMPLYVNTPDGQAVNAGEFYKKKTETPEAPVAAEVAEPAADEETEPASAEETEQPEKAQDETTEATEEEQNGKAD
jgi:phosphatidylglycerol:prolipoprotein diacylglycerol transferase